MSFAKIKRDLINTYDSLAEYWGSDKTLHDWGEDDLIKFAKAMLEAKYRKKTKLKDIKELIENGISIMERF